MQDLRHVDAYTDGACIGNPGPGGYGVVLSYGSHSRQLSGGYRKTTNNRMEMLAAVTALRALKEKMPGQSVQRFAVPGKDDARRLASKVAGQWKAESKEGHGFQHRPMERSDAGL